MSPARDGSGLLFLSRRDRLRGFTRAAGMQTMAAFSLLLGLVGLILPVTRVALAQNQDQDALRGTTTSQEEGAMEGVVVSARKDGSTITVSVISGKQGHFAFPADRLTPGHY